MTRQSLDYHARRYGVSVLIVLAILLFLVPLILRSLQGSFITPGAQGFTFLRQANLLSEGTIGYDPLSGDVLAPNPYTMLLAGMSAFGVPWLLPFLLVVLFIVLLYYYLERVVSSQSTIILALIIILVAPSTSVLATHHTTTLLCMILLVGALLSLETHPILACGMLALAAIASPVLGIMAIVFLAALSYLKERYHELLGVVIAGIVGIGWYVAWTLHFPNIMDITAPHLRFDVIFELGNTAGISIFLVILACYGIVVKYKRHHPLIVRTLFLGVATLFVPAIIPITVVPLAVFAAIGITHLLHNNWDLDLLRISLLWLVFCIALFLSITAARDRLGETPSPALTHTLINIRNQYHEGAVFTAPEYAPMVEYFSGRKAAFDENTPQSTINTALYSRSPQEVYALFQGTDTSYVLITSEMKNAYFTRSDQGLLFLVQNSERFVKLSADDESTLWYFIRTK